MHKKEKLSRGLQSLLGGVIGIEAEAGQPFILQLNVNDIYPNDLQPRKDFTDDEMRGLAESIKKFGILQPIIVKQLQHGYMIIAGERRWRAAKQIGLKEVPAIVRKTDELNTLEIALIENIQREDLNPIEKAKGFHDLINRFGLTQEQVARAIGKDRASIANYIRLLDLPRDIQELVSRGTLSMGHARALLSLPHEKRQMSLCEQIINEKLSVRAVEEIVSREGNDGKSPKKPSRRVVNSHIMDLEDRFRKSLGTKVTIREKNGKGSINIVFHSSEEFNRIAGTLGIHP